MTVERNSRSLLNYIALSAIFISALIFFSWFRLDIFTQWQIKFTWLLVAGLIVYYFFVNIRLAAVTGVILLIITALITWIAKPAPSQFSFILFLILLVGGLVLNFINSGFSRTREGLSNHLTQLLMAPYNIVNELVKYFGFNRYLGR